LTPGDDDVPLQIDIKQGDITTADTDAIVNAANNHLWMGSGVAGAIKRIGGDVIEQEAVKKGPIIPGEAVFTGAGKLRFKYIIHAAVMGQDLRTSDKLIRQATVASLKLAENLKLTSIAFPAFGTGVGGFPMLACAKIMLATVVGFEQFAQSLRRVAFYLYDEFGYVAFADALRKRTE
jgi:O-acetyl-ADP-ribose deacetylase (regulator of RNase III)